MSNVNFTQQLSKYKCENSIKKTFFYNIYLFFTLLSKENWMFVWLVFDEGFNIQWMEVNDFVVVVDMSKTLYIIYL